MDYLLIENLLNERNSRENAQLETVFQNYITVVRQFSFLKTQNENLQKEMIILKHERNEESFNGDGESPAALLKLQKKIQQLQEELTSKYRNDVEVAKEELALNRELRTTKAELEASINKLKVLELEAQTSVNKITALEDENERLRQDGQFLRNELGSIRKLLNDSEDREAKVSGENMNLILRMVAEKEKSAAQVNELNETIAKLHAQLEAFKAGGVGIVSEAGGQGGAAALGSSIRKMWSSNFSRSRAGTETEAQAADAMELEVATEAMWARHSVSIPSICINSLKVHPGEVYDVMGDESMMATAGSEGIVKLWDSNSGQLKGTLRGEKAAILSLDMRGNLVAGASIDRTCYVWSRSNERRLHRLQGHADKVNAVRIFPSSKTVATGSSDRSVKVWDIGRELSICVQTMRSTSTCNTVDGIIDGTSIASGHQDGGLRFWDSRTATKVHDLKGLHQAQITSVSFLPDRATSILTNSKDNTLKIIDARTYEVITTLSHEGYQPMYNWSRTSFSRNGAYVAAGSTDGSIFIFDVYDGSIKIVLNHSRSAITSCFWAPRQLLTANKDGCLNVWN